MLQSPVAQKGGASEKVVIRMVPFGPSVAVGCMVTCGETTLDPLAEKYRGLGLRASVVAVA